MDRRDFLKRNLQLIALGLMPGNFLSSCTTHKTIRLGALLATSHALAQDGKGTVFSLYDLDRDSLKELPLSLETGHTAIVHPKRKNILFVPESAGDKACVIDLDQWRVIREVRANPGRVFGGHGDFNQDGSLLYVSEFEPPPSGKGFLTVLNGSDFTKIRSMPSRGKYPHDVTLNRNGKILCISNLGVETGPHVKHSGIHISRFLLPEERFLDRVELNDNYREMSSEPKIPNSSRIFSDDPIIQTDARYFISFLEVAKPHLENFVYPHSHKPIVNIWSVKERRLIKEFVFDEQPITLTFLPERKYLAVVLHSGRIEFINVQNYEKEKPVALTKLLKVTTHVNPWQTENSVY